MLPSCKDKKNAGMCTQRRWRYGVKFVLPYLALGQHRKNEETHPPPRPGCERNVAENDVASAMYASYCSYVAS